MVWCGSKEERKRYFIFWIPGNKCSEMVWQIKHPYDMGENGRKLFLMFWIPGYMTQVRWCSKHVVASSKEERKRYFLPLLSHASRC